MLGSAQLTVAAGQRKIVHITLSGAGRRMLGASHRLQTKLTARRASNGTVFAVKTVGFKTKTKKH